MCVDESIQLIDMMVYISKTIRHISVFKNKDNKSNYSFTNKFLFSLFHCVLNTCN